MTSLGEKPPVKLLALDGGGIRGLSELLIIKQVMHRLMLEENAKRKKDNQKPLTRLPKPCDYFDLIGGTSTGGIIALMLGRLRMDVDMAIEHYDNLAKQVFSDVKAWGTDGKFKATKLEKAVKFVVEAATGDSESLLLDDQAEICRTFVCAKNAHNMNANIPVLFRTYQSCETHSNCMIWEAARATSAAPTLFKCIEIGRKQPFIDGGLGCNNPSQVVLEEAKNLFGTRQIGCLVSIGTGQARAINIKKPGIFQRIIPTGIIDALKAITTDCEAIHETMLRHFAKLPDTYFRLNVDQGMQGIELSEWEKFSNVEAHTVQYMKKKEVDETLTSLVNVISIPRSQLTLEQLVSPGPLIGSVQSIREHKICPPPVASFIGREEILDKMNKYFQPENENKSQRVFVLHGLGGSGKSQLAFKFVQESNLKACFSDIFYIDATNKQTLETDLEAITPGNIESSAKATLYWLKSQHKGNWLLLFDNADNVNLRLKDFFPSCAFGNILITTRNRELLHYSAKDADIKVEGMDQKDAKKLLLHLAGIEETNEISLLADAIVQELCYLALAVSQAGAYIRIHCSSSLRKYQELYKNYRDNLLQHEEIQGQDPYEQAVYKTWGLSYNKLNTDAKTFLQICSMLHHEGISEEMFKKAALSEWPLEDCELQSKVTELLNHFGKQDSGWNSWCFEGIIQCLCSYSLIEYDCQNCTYSIHPLVKYWSGTTIKGNQDTMQKCALTIVGLSICWPFSHEDYKYRCTLVQHITNSIQSIKIAEIPLFILSRIGLVYSEQGFWAEAEKAQMVVVEKRRQRLGEDHPDTLRSMAYLAATYNDLGCWKEAEKLKVMVIEKRKQILGEDHPDILSSMANLAHTYSALGIWKEAEKLEVIVMEKRKQILGEYHPDTLLSMANLAATYSKLGHWKEAEKLKVVVMEKNKQILGNDHPDTLLSMANLARTYSALGRWTEAEKLEVVVMEKRKQILREDHPDIVSSMANLARTYSALGHWKEAEKLEVVVMEKRRQRLGDDHPYTLLSMANLAATYNALGHWKEAEKLEVVVMEKNKQRLGDDHPDTLRSMANLAATYSDLGHWKEAEKLKVVVMEKNKQILGEDHPNTLRSMANLAATYGDLGHWKEAKKLKVVVMEKNKQILGEDHPNTLRSMGNLACTYRDLGHWKEAEKLGVVVMEKNKQILGEYHPDTLLSMANLAATYSDLGHWKEAEKLEVVVAEKRKQTLGDDHPDTLLSMANLARTYNDLERWTEAVDLDVVVMEKRKQILGDDHPATLLSMANLAATYNALGHWTEAKKLQVMVIEKRKHILGEDHPDILSSMANLACTYSALGHWKEAEKLEVEVMEKNRQRLGDDHPATLLSMANLARTYMDLGQWSEAEELQVVVHQKRKQMLGNDHPATLLIKSNLAITYEHQEH